MPLRSKNKVKADFNMSSMTDIVFLLLIFFMLTSTLVSQNVLEVLSSSDSEDQQNKDLIEVHINKEEEYSYKYSDADGKQEEFVEKEDLEGILKKKFLEIKDPGISLFMDKTIPVYHAVYIMNMAQKNKYKFEIATVEPLE